MRARRRGSGLIAVVAMAAAVSLAAAACGKRGNLEAPEGSVYPRTYPSAESLHPEDSAGERGRGQQEERQ